MNISILRGLALAFFFFPIVSVPTFAATTPAGGMTDIYTILSSTFTNTSATTINGSIGFTTGPALTPAGTHPVYGSVAPYATAGSDQAVLMNALGSQPCTFVFAPGAIDLSTDTTHGATAVYTPGVYCSTGAMNIGGPLTLSGSGTFIFRPVGAFTTTAGAQVSLSGGSSCDVFWTPSGATTLGANTVFTGTVVSDAGITVGANTVWIGRALSFGGTVTTDTTTITSTTCSTVVVPVVATTTPVIVIATTTPPIIVATTTPIVIATTTPIVFATTTVFISATTTPVVIVTPISTPFVPTLPYTGLVPHEEGVVTLVILLAVLTSVALLFLPRTKRYI